MDAGNSYDQFGVIISYYDAHFQAEYGAPPGMGADIVTPRGRLRPRRLLCFSKEARERIRGIEKKEGLGPDHPTRRGQPAVGGMIGGRYHIHRRLRQDLRSGTGPARGISGHSDLRFSGRGFGAGGIRRYDISNPLSPMLVEIASGPQARCLDRHGNPIWWAGGRQALGLG